MKLYFEKRKIMAEFMCMIYGRSLEEPEEIKMGVHKECMNDEASAILWN